MDIDENIKNLLNLLLNHANDYFNDIGILMIGDTFESRDLQMPYGRYWHNLISKNIVFMLQAIKQYLTIQLFILRIMEVIEDLCSKHYYFNTSSDEIT